MHLLIMECLFAFESPLKFLNVPHDLEVGKRKITCLGKELDERSQVDIQALHSSFIFS